MSRHTQQRQELLRLALLEARRHLERVGHTVGPIFSEASSRVVAATKRDVRQMHGLTVGDAFTALDGRMMRFLVTSETLFVRDAQGRQLDSFGAGARHVVAEGMAAGLGRDDIRADLAAIAAKALVGQPDAYWQVVAGAFVGRGRSYAQMGAYHEVGVKHYRVVAVMEERTSAVCRLMHGKILSVANGLAAFARAEAGASIKEVNPWPTDADFRHQQPRPALS